MAMFKSDENVKIYYEIHGSGQETIILLNGLAMSTKGWIHQIEYFKQNYTVVAFDMRCQGLSTKIEHDFHYSLHVSDLKQLIHHLKIEKAYFIGISYGTIVLKEFAILYPELCKKIVLISPVRKPDFAFELILDTITSLLQSSMMETFYDFILYASFNRPFIQNLATEYLTMSKLFKKTIPSVAMKKLFHAVDFYKDIENYNELEIPALVIGAKQDRFCNPEDAKTISQEAKNAKLVMLEGPHAIIGVNPVEVNNAITNFLNPESN